MKGFLIGVVVCVVCLLFIGGCTFFVVLGIHDSTLKRHENVKEGRANFVGAVNMGTAKMKSGWKMAQDQGLLEKATQVGYAEARSGFTKAVEAFDKAAADKASTPLQLTSLAAQIASSFGKITVSIERPPDLKMQETYKRAMALAEEGFNHIEMALRDWQATCQDFNTYRGKAINAFFLGRFWSGKFPEKVEYYEGGIERPESVRVTAEDISPGDIPK